MSEETITLTIDGNQVTDIRGDSEDVFSRGYICPKGTTLGELHHDPDRLRAPLVRRGDEFVEVSWDEAFAEVERRLRPILESDGIDAVTTYIGKIREGRTVGRHHVPTARDRCAS